MTPGTRWTAQAFGHEDRLPRLPMPSLDDTCDRFISRCAPLLTAEDLARTVELLELLYNVPPLYHLNLEEFQRRKTQIQRHYTFFSPLHRRLAEVPLTDFQYLTDDRAVQQTTFGDQIDLVANFSQTDFKFGGTVIPPRSILAQGRGGEKPLLYTP